MSDLDFAKNISLGNATFGNMEAKMEYGPVLKAIGLPAASYAVTEEPKVPLIKPRIHIPK
jgi:hypothetical protein